MSVPKVTGYPDYSFAGTNKWIPLLFSGKALEKFYAASVASNISTTDYIGDIKNVGDRIIIRTIPNITIRDYQKGATLQLDYPESPSVEFTINRAKYFNFAMDDVDVKETDMDWLSQHAEDAAQQMKIVIDTEFLGSVYADAHADNKGSTAGSKSHLFNLGTAGAPVNITPSIVLDTLIDCATVLDEQAIPDDNRFIVIPPLMFNLLNKSDLANASWSGLDQSTVLSNFTGKSIARFNIFVSNQVSSVIDGTAKCFNILFGRKGAIVFAAQLNKTEKYRPPTTFADAMKGLMVYDFKGINAPAIGHLYATFTI